MPKAIGMGFHCILVLRHALPARLVKLSPSPGACLGAAREEVNALLCSARRAIVAANCCCFWCWHDERMVVVALCRRKMHVLPTREADMVCGVHGMNVDGADKAREGNLDQSRRDELFVIAAAR